MVQAQSGGVGGAAGLQYPDRFYAAAAYAGFLEPHRLVSNNTNNVGFSDDTALLLFALYQQGTVGPCNIAKPWSWNVIEYAKWSSWSKLEKMPSTEAMRLFVRTLEEEDADWWVKAQNVKNPSSNQDPAPQTESNDGQVVTSSPGSEKRSQEEDEKTAVEDRAISPLSKSITIIIGFMFHNQRTEWFQACEQCGVIELEASVVLEWGIQGDQLDEDSLGAADFVPVAEQEGRTPGKNLLLVSSNGTPYWNGDYKKGEKKPDESDGWVFEGETILYDQWLSPKVVGRKPPARYQHAAAIVKDRMFVIGGNHNGRYLNDVQVLDLKSLMWSKLEPKRSASPSAQNAVQLFPPCAGHSLIKLDTKLLLVAGHSKELSDTVTVRSFNTDDYSWSLLPSYGQAPISRGGQSVTKVGSVLLMFGGEDSKRRLYNDINILDLETMTWDAVEARGVRPSPRSDHSAAIYADRYFFVFGGGSHSTCFNDLYVLDLETMEWSLPQQQGVVPTPRAGHAGVTIGDNWYIIGGGDNKSGISDTMVLNMSTLVWHVVSTEKSRTSIASEGLSAQAYFNNDEENLISFGGYNGRYSNEVLIFTASPAEKSKQKVLQSPAAAAAAASAAAAFSFPRSPAVASPSTNGTLAAATSDMQPAAEKDPSQDEAVMKKNTTESLEETEAEIQIDATSDKQVPTAEVLEDLQAATLLAQSEAAQFRQDLAAALQSNGELEKELHSVRHQLVSEQSRCFRLEVDVAELRQKLQFMEELQKELELLRRQKAALDEAVANATQSKQSSGVWSWLAGSQNDLKSMDYRS